MRFSEAALLVLSQASEPLHYKEVAARALEQGLVTSKGKTPHETMRVELARLIRAALDADEPPPVESLGEGRWRLTLAGAPAAEEQAEAEPDEAPALSMRERRRLLWGLLEGRADELDQELRFPVYWAGRSDQGVDVTLLGSQLRVRVTPGMAEAAAHVSEDYLQTLTKERAGRPFMERAVSELRDGVGKTVNLNTYAVAVLVPKDLPNRKTVTISVYRRFYVDPKDLAPFLDDEDQAKLAAAQKDKKRDLLRLNEITRAIFPQAGDTGEGGGPEGGDDEGPEDDGGEGKPEAEVRPWASNRNVIFFGPPGTGKSFYLASVVRKHLAATPDRVLRVTFHPEYSYYDFVGSYRPAVGWLRTATSFVGADGTERSEEPRTYYHFDPGPLSRALQLAAANPEQPAVLIIEEINRGNCAAIFGEVFQLLDRINDKERAKQRGLSVGTSEYAINPSAEWAAWLRQQLPESNAAFSPEQGSLRLPPNLYLYATMNTSDQSLFPMDTAFRRRWGMEFVGIGRSTDERVRVPLHVDDEKGVPWLRLMRHLNTRIVRHTRSDDKQMGPYFVRPASVGAMVGTEDFCAKVIFYLWSDVFRDQPAAVFDPKLTTYEEVVAAFKAGKHVFLRDLLEQVGVLSKGVSESPGSEAAEEPSPSA